MKIVTVVLGLVLAGVLTSSAAAGGRHHKAKHYVSHHKHHHYVSFRRHRHAPAKVKPIRMAAGDDRGGSSDIVNEARRWMGGNPTGRRSLWCAAFMNFVLERTGHRGSGSNYAASFARYGHRVSGPQVGAIAVMARRGGGHVGVVAGVDAQGNPIIISGNHGHRVAEAVYPGRRIYAYVMP